MQIAMFATPATMDNRSPIQSALCASYAQLIEEMSKLLKDNHYSGHELYELSIHKGLLKPTHFREFQKFLRWGVREGYLDGSRIISRTVKGVRIPNRFTKEQLISYFQTVQDPRIAVASFLAVWSGLRIGDTIKLKIEDFDFEAETVKIVQSKRSKDRIAPFLREGQSVIQKWARYAGATEYLFPSYCPHSMATLNTPHISSRTITDGFNVVIRNANLQRVDERYVTQHNGQRKKFTFHTFRHTFCTYHLEHEVSAAFVARAAGHSNMNTTVGVYGHMASTKMIRAFRRSYEEGRKRSTKPTQNTSPAHKPVIAPDSKNPMNMLAEKFIAGEIDETTFRRKKGVLMETGIM